MDTDWLDEDGYPTELSLIRIEQWDDNDPKGWLEFIKSLWYMASCCWHEADEQHEWRDEKVRRYRVSTAGWSGNESIIRAMQYNVWLWDTVWVQSRRGGHYVFELSGVKTKEESYDITVDLTGPRAARSGP